MINMRKILRKAAKLLLLFRKKTDFPPIYSQFYVTKTDINYVTKSGIDYVTKGLS